MGFLPDIKMESSSAGFSSNVNQHPNYLCAGGFLNIFSFVPTMCVRGATALRRWNGIFAGY
jgi:hypothetical protein